MKHHSLLATLLAGLFSFSGMAAENIILNEDFSKFTAGTTELADDVNIGATADDPYSSGQLDTYTLTPGWNAYGIYQADGTAVLKGIDLEGYTMNEITSPAVAIAGGVKATVRIRLYNGEGNQNPVKMRALFQKGWTFSAEEYFDVTSEWQEFTYTTKVKEGDWQLRLSFMNDDSSTSAVQIDYIKVEKNNVQATRPDAPRIAEPTSVTDTSFRANWHRVGSVTDYKVYVTYPDGDQTKFFLEGENVQLASSYSSTSLKVEGLNPDIIYSYYVTAVDGGLESEPSETMDVIALSIPNGLAVTEQKADSFTAKWNNVPKATDYEVTLYALTPEGAVEKASYPATEPSYTFSGLDKGNYYGFTVKASREYKEKKYETKPSVRMGAYTGELTKGDVEITEDFAKFTNGSLENVYYKENNNDDPNSWGEYVNNFQSEVIPDEMTSNPGWKGFGVAEAGGTAAICYQPYPAEYWGGYISTPKVGGKSLVTIKFRAAGIPQFLAPTNENPAEIKISATTTGSDSPVIDFIIAASTGLKSSIEYYKDDYDDSEYTSEKHYFSFADNDWHEFQATFLYTGEAPISIRLGSKSDDGKPFFIDDIEVSTSPLAIEAPKAWEADNFTKDGFTAYWGEVAKADSYLLSVYRRKAGKNDYAITDLEVKGTEYTVTGLDAWSDWFFTVKAKKGNVISEASEPMAAIGISTPETKPATELSDNGFTAVWERTPKATRYEITLYRGDKDSELAEIEKKEIEEGETTTYLFSNLDTKAGKKFAYTLKAFYDTSADTYESGVSAPEYVDLSLNGVETVAVEAISVSTADGILSINAPAGTLITVSTLDGKNAFSAVSQGETLSANLPAGVYIVRVAEKSIKVII